MPFEFTTHRLFTLTCIWFAGLLLIAAGLLKLLYPPPLIVVQLPAEVFSGLWVCEIALGLWLVSGINRVQAFLFGTLAFSGLAVASGWMALSGLHNCGCLGTLPTNPWVMCGLDVMAALGLGVSLLYSTDRVVLRHGFRHFFASSTITAVILAAIATLAVGRYGSIEAAVGNWQGHSLEVPRSVDAIPQKEDGTFRATIPVRNHSDAPVRIIGTDVCCGSRVETQFPKTLNPGESDILSLVLNCSRRTSLVVTLWVESENKLKKQRVVVACRNRD